MSNTNEPRALTAALSQPAFVTKGGGFAMHAANRHVSRWAPEVGEPGANRIRPLRNLGFVDRLVAPWIESAQRTASLRMFGNYINAPLAERPAPTTSWVFPRPWYQDELDWMAAARAVGSQTAVEQAAAPQMFTTRGTYVAPQQAPSSIALPSVLHEYIAPSLSIARPDVTNVSDAYSPLVPLAATSTAQLMARAMAPLLTQSAQAPSAAAQTVAAARMSPGLRAVLATMLERSTNAAYSAEPTRVSMGAPELVTPPAPRAETPVSSSTASNVSYEQATQVADQYAEQRVRIAELQRVARVAAEREFAQRMQAQQTQTQPAQSTNERAEARTAELRAIEHRQAELQKRASDVATQRQTERVAVDAARREADRVAADVERARLEERIAQRLAERTRGQQDGQRLHAAARESAARDALAAPQPEISDTRDAPRSAPSEARVAAELAAAVASLPPELATMVAGSISNRPERAAQAIAELGDALRTIELIARNTAAGGTIEPTRGPRVVMPAGLGGLVSTVERTVAPSVATARIPSFAMPVAQPPPQRSAATAATMRMPAMTFLAAPSAATLGGVGSSSALGAAASATPAALSHVAWSDRWLARFAGAKASSLDVLSAASASPEMRFEMLAAAAPNAVFVAPFFDDNRPVPTPIAYSSDGEVVPRATDALPTLRGAVPERTAVRIADDAETSDDIFAAISRARAGAVRPAVPSAPPSTVPSSGTSPVTTFAERETLADLVAHAAPSAPGAGLAAGLASSPFAPALRHLLPLGAASAFDVRALFGGSLGATYLAGLLAAGTDEITAPAPVAPSWATWTQTAGAMTALPAFADDEQPMREVAGFDATYVMPDVARPSASIGGDGASVETDAAVAAHAQAEHVTTLRSALLTFDVETIAAQSGVTPEMRVSATSVAAGPSLARSMIESMTMPMLGETAALGDINTIDIAGMSGQAPSYAAPGMIADRALGWSVAQERSTSDLSFDFVSPELVLAARVYGLGPAEAAQAARLAIAGPGQLSAMANTVDRTFVQALAIEGERRERVAGARQLTSAYPTASGDTATVTRPAYTAAAVDELDVAAPSASRSLFGVERRAPRGAFLWPAATTAALGLNAAAPDGELSMSVVALELLAAQAVAELGTYAALGERGLTSIDGGTVSTSSMSMTPGDASEGTEADVLASAAAMVPAARRDKFQALYVALGQSTTGKTWSPAARAARAFALAGRGEDSMSPRERASVAWDVLPVVFATDSAPDAELSTGDAATRAVRRRDELRALEMGFVESRPGLGGLSARAGEALGSYVASTGPMTQSGSGAAGSTRDRGEGGAVLRAPTAAQELVQTGRPSGRYGGGEVEIPPWFEAAAKKMLLDRSMISDGISLAELTLVQTAAPTQIAASSRHDGGATHSLTPAPSAAAGAEKEQIDVEKLANQVYREILVLMDIARVRNGDPYL